MNKRVLGIDVGDVRIGVAVSDPGLLISQGLSYIKRIGYSKDIAAIKDICIKYGDIETIVVGLPLLMSGIEGEQARKTKEFASKLEENGFNIIFQDERLSSVSATSVLINNGVRREKRKNFVDQIAATIILQSWLDKYNNEKRNKNG